MARFGIATKIYRVYEPKFSVTTSFSKDLYIIYSLMDIEEQRQSDCSNTHSLIHDYSRLRWFLSNNSCRWNILKPSLNVASSVFRKTAIKTIHHRARRRDMMDQSYPIHACTRAHHARCLFVYVTFCGSWKYSRLDHQPLFGEGRPDTDRRK